MALIVRSRKGAAIPSPLTARRGKMGNPYSNGQESIVSLSRKRK
jgi:hypothetical protein